MEEWGKREGEKRGRDRKKKLYVDLGRAFLEVPSRPRGSNDSCCFGPIN